MRWLWAAIAGLAIVVFIAIEFLAVERFRPDPVSKDDFGTLYFENNARMQILRTEVSGRCSRAKKLVEAQLGKFNTPIMVWCASELSQEVTRNGHTVKESYGGEVTLRPDGSNSLVIRIATDNATSEYVTLLFARARMLEIAGEPATVRNPQGKLKNGLGYYIADSEAAKMRDPILWLFGNPKKESIDEDFARSFKEDDVVGWMICADLHLTHGWSCEKIARASEDEIKKLLVKDDNDPFSTGYRSTRWCSDAWSRIKDKLKPKK